MLNKIIITATLTLLSLITWAQPGSMQDERVEAFRVAFISRMLDLSPEEAEKFWPLYNQFREDRKTIQERYRQDKRFELMSDQEMEDYVNDTIEKEQKLLDLKEDYLQKLKNILPIRKVAMIPRVEEKFKEELLKRLQERARNRPRRRGN